jgi:actin-like protein 6A
MYGGDEVSAIVIDAGSSCTRGGFAGEENPKVVFPSNVGVVLGSEGSLEEGSTKNSYYVGTNSLAFRRDFMEMKSPFDHGLVSDWEMMEQLWDHAFLHQLRIEPSKHPLLISEPSFNTRPLREKLTELIFEKYQTPALFVSKAGVLTAFASGKASALVLDSGGGVTSATPVHDGYVLQKCIVKSSLAGDLLTQEYRSILEKRGVQIRPHFMIKSKKEVEGRTGQFEVQLKDLPNTTASYRDYAISEVVRDIKETVCRVSDITFNEEANSNIPAVAYELPDGHTVELGTDRFSIPELMFNPSPINKKEGAAEEFIGAQHMIYNSVGKCDPDIRRELFNSIIVTGGNTLLPQFSERLHKELLDKSPPQMYKVKILATTSPAERKYSVWIGGSILASLGTFQQMWMSKQEYEEHGAHLVERKCP